MIKSIIEPTPCPVCGSALEEADATTFDVYVPRGVAVRGRDLPLKTRQTVVAACSGCEFIVDLKHTKRVAQDVGAVTVGSRPVAELTTHIAATGQHGEQRCGRCGVLLARLDDGFIAYGRATDWSVDSWTFYPYASGDKVVRGPAWQAVALSSPANPLPPVCERVVMVETYRFGSLVLEIPENPNLPVEVRRDGVLAGRGYREALKRGHLEDGPLSDAEIMWLLGFDDEVGDHETAWRAVTEG